MMLGRKSLPPAILMLAVLTLAGCRGTGTTSRPVDVPTGTDMPAAASPVPEGDGATGDGPVERRLGPFTSIYIPAAANDRLRHGEFVAFLAEDSEGMGIWAATVDGRWNRRLLTFRPASDSSPRGGCRQPPSLHSWLDGDRLAFTVKGFQGIGPYRGQAGFWFGAVSLEGEVTSLGWYPTEDDCFGVVWDGNSRSALLTQTTQPRTDTLYRLDLRSGELTTIFSALYPWSWSPNRRWFAYRRGGQEVHLFEPATGRDVTLGAGYVGSVLGEEWSRRSDLVGVEELTESGDPCCPLTATVNVYRPDGTLAFTARPEEGEIVERWVWMPDGRRLVAVAVRADAESEPDPGAVRVLYSWDAATGARRQVAELHGHGAVDWLGAEGNDVVSAYRMIEGSSPISYTGLRVDLDSGRAETFQSLGFRAVPIVGSPGARAGADTVYGIERLAENEAFAARLVARQFGQPDRVIIEGKWGLWDAVQIGTYIVLGWTESPLGTDLPEKYVIFQPLE